MYSGTYCSALYVVIVKLMFVDAADVIAAIIISSSSSIGGSDNNYFKKFIWQ